MEKTVITELIPANGRKSFYGKAKVIDIDDIQYLKSYDTIVASIDKSGIVHRYYDDKTPTTSKHIISFLDRYSTKNASDIKEFYKLPCENTPTLMITI